MTRKVEMTRLGDIFILLRTKNLDCKIECSCSKFFCLIKSPKQWSRKAMPLSESKLKKFDIKSFGTSNCLVSLCDLPWKKSFGEFYRIRTICATERDSKENCWQNTAEKVFFNLQNSSEKHLENSLKVFLSLISMVEN